MRRYLFTIIFDVPLDEAERMMDEQDEVFETFDSGPCDSADPRNVSYMTVSTRSRESSKRLLRNVDASFTRIGKDIYRRRHAEETPKDDFLLDALIAGEKDGRYSTISVGKAKKLLRDPDLRAILESDILTEEHKAYALEDFRGVGLVMRKVLLDISRKGTNND